MEVSGQPGGKEVPVPIEEKARCTPGLGISEKRKSLDVVGNLTADRPAHGAVPPPFKFLGPVLWSNVLPFRPFFTRDTAPTHAAPIAIRSHLVLSIPWCKKTAVLVPTFRRSGSSVSH